MCKHWLDHTVQTNPSSQLMLYFALGFLSGNPDFCNLAILGAGGTWSKPQVLQDEGFSSVGSTECFL